MMDEKFNNKKWGSIIKVSPSNFFYNEITIPGYKHAMVQIIAAAISNNCSVMIKNIPVVDDTIILMDIINNCGGTCEMYGTSLYCDPTKMNSYVIDEQFSRLIHGVIYLIPAYIAKFGQCDIGLTGGCQIGDDQDKKERPVKHMEEVMNIFGVSCSVMNNHHIGTKDKEVNASLYIDIRKFSESTSTLSGSFISGATKTSILLMPFVNMLTISHPYNKSDVRELIKFYKLLGYEIETDRNKLVISSNTHSSIQNQNVVFELTDCVSEIMTYISFAVYNNIEIKLQIKDINGVKNGLQQEFILLDKIGVKYELCDTCIKIFKCSNLNNINIDVTNDSIQSDHLPFFVLILLRRLVKITCYSATPSSAA